MATRTRLPEALRCLRRELKRHPDLRLVWKANLAMAFYDEWCVSGRPRSRKAMRTVVDRAATRFVGYLFPGERW